MISGVNEIWARHSHRFQDNKQWKEKKNMKKYYEGRYWHLITVDPEERRVYRIYICTYKYPKQQAGYANIYFRIDSNCTHFAKTHWRTGIRRLKRTSSISLWLGGHRGHFEGSKVKTIWQSWCFFAAWDFVPTDEGGNRLRCLQTDGTSDEAFLKSNKRHLEGGFATGILDRRRLWCRERRI